MKSNIYKKSISYLRDRKVFIREKYTKKIKKYSDSLNILVLQWQRRVGKSYTLIWFIKDHNINLDSVFYINKELDINEEIQNQKDLNNLFIEVSNSKNIKYIIIDEIQNIKNWEKFILWVYSEKKYKIIITWSNSKLLSSELSTLLTWRFMTINIFPFDYKEFLEIKEYKIKNIENKLNSKKERFWDMYQELLEKVKEIRTNEKKYYQRTTRRIPKYFKEYITYGWMPEILFLQKNELKNNYIQNTLNSILLKDIVDRYWIKNIKLLEKILQFIQSEVGNIISITNISNYVKNIFKKEVSLTTISNYIKYLTYPYIINEVQRYDIKWKKILDYNSKYYFSDIWIRNIYWFSFANDIWKILENLVFIKLISSWYKVYVWEVWWNEIDFIALKWWEKLYIQVCYLLSSDNVIKREFWNLLKIKDNYEKIVLSLDDTFWNTYEGVKNLNLIDFILR